MASALEHFKAGTEAYKAGDLETATDELEAACHLDAGNHKAFNYLGAVYAAKGRFNAAVGAFKAAEQIAPGVTSTHYNIGQAYEADGLPEEAEYEYEKAIKIDPNYTKAVEALANLKKRLHHI